MYTRGETQTAGVYLFDTMSFAEKWQFTAGFRVDSFETDFDRAVLSTAVTHPTLPVGTLVPSNVQVEDTLFSYKVGLLYKPVENGSIYLSHAISQQPPGGTNFIFSTAANNANQPESRSAEGHELRARRQVGIPRWRLRRHRRDLPQHQRERVVRRIRVIPRVILQIGERKVEGIELGFVGKLTDSWELSAGVANMDTEIKRGLANQQRAADQLDARVHVHQLDHLPHALRSLDRRWRRATWTA